MIKDRLENASTYYKISENLQKGFEWLKTTDLKSIADGKYLIDNNNVYANVQSYETKDSAPYEAHREYADIQYLVSGSEKIGVTDYSNCSVLEKYNPQKDIEFLHFNSNETYHTINEGDFLVLFPQDAHKPSINTEQKTKVKKVVIKVKI